MMDILYPEQDSCKFPVPIQSHTTQVLFVFVFPSRLSWNLQHYSICRATSSEMFLSDLKNITSLGRIGIK